MSDEVTKFSDIEVAALAKKHNCDVQSLVRRWIIQQGRSFYVLGPEGEYLRPIMKGELAQSLMRDLKRVPAPAASAAGIEWYKARGDNLVRKNVDDLLFDYCTVARSVVADMSLARSAYDAKEQIFYEAVCPLRDVTPRFHEPIAEWLRLFGGPQHNKLLDWIATLTRTDRPSCALLVTGKSSAGKELLAQGLARRWKWANTPTELGRVLDGFNEDLARCPLVFCDEKLPATRGGKQTALADLRSMIAASSRTLARKFLSNADLIGALRLILAANNNNLISSSDDMSIDDQEATAIRFLHIKVDEKSGNYLKSIGGRDTTDAWVAGNMVAEHAAWLEKNHVITTWGHRFIVEGDASDIQRQLLVNNKNTSIILEWVVQFLVAGSASSSAALVGNGDVLINATTVSSSWNQHVRSDFVPSTTRIGASLRVMALREVRHDWASADGKLREVRYQAINPEFIYEWSRQNQVGDPDALRRRVEAKLDIEEMKRRAAFVGVGKATPLSPIPTLPPGAMGHFNA